MRAPTPPARRRPPATFWAAIAAAQVTVTAVTWHDLRQRTPDQVRGSKTFWRVFSALNMGNAALYWLFARRQLSGGTCTLDRVPRPRAGPAASGQRVDVGVNTGVLDVRHGARV
jgi:hypothetical protein